MAPDEEQLGSAAVEENTSGETASGEGEEKPKLELEVKIDSRSACERHVTVTIPRNEVDRYLDLAYSDMMDKAVVPGFRAGRAPRKLVQLRFRKEVGEQVKGSLLMDSLGQISESHELSPISEPDFDPTAVEVPETGPLVFEFDIEVRPEFALPNWKGLQIERPVREFTAKDIERQMKELLAKHGRLVPFDGPAETGDYLTLNIAFKHGETLISSVSEEVILIRPTLSFRDGKVEGFDRLMQGAVAGEKRVGQAKLAVDAPNQELQGKTITAEFEVLEVKKLELPELTKTFLEQIGDFGSEADLRDAIKDMLERRLKYEQQQRARQQILASLTEAANWDLPPGLLKRQSQREMERALLELRSSGFSDNEIRLHENELRQNSRVNTARALKEHFILERIAEEEKIEEQPEDYDMEIARIAQQSGESPRRVRAQLEKRNLMDTLRNQIIERKAIDLILEHAIIKEVPYELEGGEAVAVDQTAGGEEVEIPEAHNPDMPGEAPHRVDQHK
ncbi:MAG TPA: trigger factor [Pirellulales bacterium]|nr:trigger factor [Pirellulales bacterium]